MNGSTQILIKKMRELTIPEDATRTVRAMFIAQCFAYQVPLTADATVESILELYEKDFIGLVNDVNERLQLDIKLAKNLFKRLVEGRLMIMNRVTSLALLTHALSSDEQTARLNAEENSSIKMLLDSPNFKTIQADVAEFMFIEDKVQTDND